MATFKPNDRARIVNSKAPYNGKECTILSPCRTEPALFELVTGHEICIDGIGRVGPTGLPWFAGLDQLVPLTDPRADEFVADLERFAIAADKTERERIQPLTLEELDRVRAA